MKKNKQIIIEFNGFSGSGKTTTSLQLINELKLSNLNVWSFSDFITNEKKPNIYRLMKALKNVPLSITLQLVRLTLSQKSFSKKLLEMFLACFYIFEKYILLKTNTPDFLDFLVVDQGIIQGIISIFHTNTSVTQKQKKIIKKILNYFSLNNNLLIINSRCDIQLTINRIKIRSGSGGRFDSMNEMELKENLLKQEILFKLFRNILNELEFDQIDIKMDDSPKKNSYIIANAAEKMFNS